MIKKVLILAAFVLSISLQAQEITSPAARLSAVVKDAEDARNRYFQSIEKLPEVPRDDPKIAGLEKAMTETEEKAMATALEIAQADPQSETSFDAFSWIVMHDTTSATAASAIGALTKYHAANPKLGRPIAYMAYYIQFPMLPTYGPFEELMNVVLQKNPDRTTRAQAAMGIARRAQWAYGGAETRNSNDRERLAEEAQKALGSVIRDYGDCPDLREAGGLPAQATVALELESDLYELTHLRIGQLAPTLEGEDLEGARIRLADYRGQVVMLVFWASWCGPCMAAVPDERALVERFQNRPFVVVGVNGDQNKAAAFNAIAKNRITWNSFWNGPRGAAGPIAKAWNVRGWPTLYVIDAAGVIRYKNVIPKDLAPALDQLVAEAETTKKR